ncbi:MAG: hypothetical protein ACM3MD_03400 [Betaproteobacteria bacterium]
MNNKHRLAAILAIILGLLSIKEGGSVLLGLSTKAYTVLPWLVWYNVVLGFVSVITGIGVWVRSTWSVTFATTIVTLHGLVLMILIILFSFREAVALISIMAMLFRTLVWVGIMMLLRWRSRGQEGNA